MSKKNIIKMDFLKKKTGGSFYYRIGALVAAVLLWFYVISASVGLPVEHIYNVPVELRNLGAEYVLLEQNYQVQVRVQGANQVLQELQAKDINAVIDLSGFDVGEHNPKITVSLPEGVQLVSLSQSTLALTIEAMKTSEFPLIVNVNSQIGRAHV